MRWLEQRCHRCDYSPRVLSMGDTLSRTIFSDAWVVNLPSNVLASIKKSWWLIKRAPSMKLMDEAQGCNKEEEGTTTRYMVAEVVSWQGKDATTQTHALSLANCWCLVSWKWRFLGNSLPCIHEDAIISISTTRGFMAASIHWNKA